MTIDLLHSLVLSLTRSEKRYFRLIAGPRSSDKKFLQLFDCLLKHAVPDAALDEELARLFPQTTLEPARKHLYRVLMQSLRQFEQSKRIDVQISQLLHEAQILYERGLVHFSQQQLEKARTLAEKHERSLHAVLAARQQVEQWVRWQFDGIDEPLLAKQHELIRKHNEHAQAALQHAALYETLLLRYQRQGMTIAAKDNRWLNDLLLEEYQILSRQKHKSFSIQQRHLHFQSAYFRMLGDGAGSMKIYQELDALFQKNTKLWAEEPIYYVQLLEGILTDLRLMKKYDEMPFFIERLRLIDASKQGLGQTIPYLALYYSMLMLVDQQQYADAREMLQLHLADGAGFERGLSQLPVPTRVEFDLLLVRLDVGQGRLTAGLQRLNKVLERPQKSLPYALYTQSRLMNLLIHARLGNADYLLYALRSMERKLRVKGAGPSAEQFVLSLIQHWLSGKTPADLVIQSGTFSSSPADQQLLRNLDIDQWITAIIAI